MSKHATNGLTWRSGVDLGVNGIVGGLVPVQQMLALIGVQPPRGC